MRHYDSRLSSDLNSGESHGLCGCQFPDLSSREVYRVITKSKVLGSQHCYDKYCVVTFCDQSGTFSIPTLWRVLRNPRFPTFFSYMIVSQYIHTAGERSMVLRNVFVSNFQNTKQSRSHYIKVKNFHSTLSPCTLEILSRRILLCCSCTSDRCCLLNAD